MDKQIAILICCKDRPTEVFGLLQSLRTQSLKSFDVFILDDGSTTPLYNFYFIQYMITRMKLEGNHVKVIRNEQPSGVSKARQCIVDEVMKNHYKYPYLCRLDDDVLLEPTYLEELIIGINKGYDLMSGLTIPFGGPSVIRSIKNVKPIIGYCELDNKGNLIANFDDCGVGYNEKEILPTPHFRSCCLYKRELHEQAVDYQNRLSKNGFREEQVFSFKAVLKGFKLGVNTGAINYHLLTPSGGERDTMNLGAFNQQIFEDTVKNMYEDKGDFLANYYKNTLKIEVPKLTREQLSKQTNLVSNK
jgi:glycosyltransferase involved in cell wall biosynthesis